jgi:uncharacterized protein YlxP (DUF503 family)
MPVGLLLITFHFPGCQSLKEKRSHIKPILARLQREFNLSVAELGRQDAWQYSEMGCALVANDAVFIRQVFQKVIRFANSTWPDVEITDEHIEFL